jgi:tRNA-Thr(GGU) m(6)t(6)A37 methyltransferase TsaA
MSREAKVHFIGVVARTAKQEAQVLIFPEFCPGLREITGFSHLIVLYWMHLRDDKKDRETLLVFPKKHAVSVETGVFACRSPSRPNPIGLCVVELMKLEKCMLTLKGLDAVQGSPIIDVKPYLPRADCVADARVPEWTGQGPAT